MVNITGLEVQDAGGIFIPLADSGQVVIIPNQLRGRATPISPAAFVTGMAVQFNDDELFNAFPPPYDPFTIALADVDFPTAGDQYRLTLHAWDDLGDHTEKSVTFTRA